MGKETGILGQIIQGGFSGAGTRIKRSEPAYLRKRVLSSGCTTPSTGHHAAAQSVHLTSLKTFEYVSSSYSAGAIPVYVDFSAHV